MWRTSALWLAVGILASAALAWNASRFVGTKIQPRTKDLTFLPSPVVAQALALGQPTAVAKLRWIDSFSYFSLQVERQDDHVAGADGRGGMERLYDTLIALDPAYLPFYEHAVLNTGGVLKDHRAAIGFVQRGLLEMPHSTELWRLGAAELAISFDWTVRQPVQLDAWLSAWSDAEPPGDRQAVLDWRRGLAFRHVDGLETLPYWLEQLRSTHPGTPLADFVDDTVRELLSTHAEAILPALVAAGGDADLALDPAAVAAHYPRGIPAWAPVSAAGDGIVQLRSDPYGWPFRRSGSRIECPGYQHVRFEKMHVAVLRGLEEEGQRRGRQPRDAAEAKAWGGELAAPPDGGAWMFDQPRPYVRWPDPPHSPWQLRGDQPKR